MIFLKEAGLSANYPSDCEIQTFCNYAVLKAGRDLYRATLAVTRGLDFGSLIF